MVIFLNHIRSSEGLFWGISNFLSKIKSGETVMLEDVKYIYSKSVQESDGVRQKDWVDWTAENEQSFREIRKPDKLGETLENVSTFYCLLLELEELRDVSDLYMYLLLKLYFKEETICLLLTGNEKGYYTVSDFFSTVLQEDDGIYNSLFYHVTGENYSKRLAREKERGYTSFLPIQIISQPFYEFLSGAVHTQVCADWLAELFRGTADWKEVRKNSLLYGSMRLLEKQRKLFDKMDINRITGLIANSTVLGGLLFAFSIKTFSGQRDGITVSVLSDYLEQLDEYARGCLQLIENVLFHSQSHTGVFSFRLCKEEKRYLRQKYGEDAIISGTGYLELIIADYAGENFLSNMAENFIQNIQEEEIKEKFAGLVPADFFSLEQIQDEAMKTAWRAYYSIPDNLGKHFGLRIFKDIIQNCKGRFLLQSHKSHRGRKGETYNYLKEESRCYPGTSYAVLLPIRELNRQLSYTAIGIDKDADTKCSLDDSAKYSIAEKELHLRLKRYKSQGEKDEIIRSLADELETYCTQNKDAVIYFSLQNWESVFGELLCKAILMVGHRVDKMSHMVFYHCAEELTVEFLSVMLLIYKNSAIEFAVRDKNFQIALFTENKFEEIVIFPGSYSKTTAVNERLNFTKGTFASWMQDMHPIESSKKVDNDYEKIPFELLHEVKCGDTIQTIFEHYAESVIKRDIQEQAFGCHIKNTHMRLGSTIHVDSFYEAELLFGSQLFISGFAFLLMRQLKALISNNETYTIYGYATYSELLVFEVMRLLKANYDSIEVDYAILEREIEQRGDSHIDRIRYSQEFSDIRERVEHFADRKIICVIPISSTLKTNEKMLNIFCEENGENCRTNILENFSLVLVGTEGENDYWELNDEKRMVGKEKLNLSKDPRYFVEVTLNYEEASACNMCYPANILEESPLIEVNAASTIPNQAFGLYPRQIKQDKIFWDNLELEEQKLSVLKDSLIYSHVKRGENHYLYYFQTDKLMIQHSTQIEEWLDGIEKADQGEYHIIFCPMHFSNAGFLEYINKTVFHDAAIIIRDDIDKVYRSNIIAKYSNLQLLMEKMEQYAFKEEVILKFYYVDDSIITGRTFYRSKSLVESIINMYAIDYSRVKAHIFEKIFVLVDRNSRHSRMQYIRCWDSADRRLEYVDKDYYVFREVNISSIRNHGDSCILCKLEEEAGILECTSSTKQTAEYWKKEREKFSVKTLKEYLKEEENPDRTGEEWEASALKRKRGIRRLVCTDIATNFLEGAVHGNDTERAVYLILKLLITDFKGRSQDKEEAVEYFFSYLKVLSRPFLAFQKVLREAIFDILLVLMENFLTEKEITVISDSMQETKPYFRNEDIRGLFGQLIESVLPCIIEEKQQKNYFTILMKQLSELKSNYIIRLENMNKIAKYINSLEKGEQENLYRLYMEYVKKLVGVSSDTSKSAWLDFALHNHREAAERERVTIELPAKIQEKLYLENTRVFYDGIKKLSVRFANLQESELAEFQEQLKDSLKEYQFGNFNKLLKDYSTPNNKEQCLRSIVACIQLMQLIETQFQKAESDKKVKLVENEKEMLEKCNQIVKLISRISGADYTMLIMEIPSECEHWKTVLADSWNKWLRHVGYTRMLETPQDVDNLVLTDSRDGYDKIQEFDKDVAEKLQKYRESSGCSNDGYVVNMADAFLIWEMESRPQHPMYIYAKLSKDLEYWENLNNIRNAMMFYHMLNAYVFNYHNSSQLYELIVRARDVQLMNYDKAHIHTGYEARMKLVKQACQSNMDSDYYRSISLTLLADIKVSEIFRKSLKNDYYMITSRVKSIPWNSESALFNKGMQIFATGQNNSVRIDLRFEPIVPTDKKLEENEGILCYSVDHGDVESFLLIYAIVQNAGIMGRSDVQNGGIEVHLSKTYDGNLRICNKLPIDKEKLNIDEINSNIRMMPADGTQGISLWSVSRYLKGLQYWMLETKLIELRKSGNSLGPLQLETFRETVHSVINGGYDVLTKYVKSGEAEYFSVEIPILSCRYEQPEKLFRFKEKR